MIPGSRGGVAESRFNIWPGCNQRRPTETLRPSSRWSPAPVYHRENRRLPRSPVPVAFCGKCARKMHGASLASVEPASQVRRLSRWQLSTSPCCPNLPRQLLRGIISCSLSFLRNMVGAPEKFGVIMFESSFNQSRTDRSIPRWSRMRPGAPEAKDLLYPRVAVW